MYSRLSGYLHIIVDIVPLGLYRQQLC